MSAGCTWLILGWVPLWFIALALGAPRRPARWIIGGCLAAFVAGVAAAEMRRHGLLIHHAGEPYLPALSLYLHELVRFFLIGASGALAGDWAQDLCSRWRKGGGTGDDAAASARQ